MLSLDSTYWSQLAHAYGSAADIPPLLRQLHDLPGDGSNAEPWYSLWSALAHQGEVFQASFAATPYIVAALESAPAVAPPVYLHFPAWIEVCRLKAGLAVEHSLAAPYFEALARLPTLALAAISRADCGVDLLQCSLAAIAVSKGQAQLSEAVLELTPQVATAFLEWHFSQ